LRKGSRPTSQSRAFGRLVDGKLVDLSYPLQQDASVRIVTDRSPEALALYRHSTAHLLAAGGHEPLPRHASGGIGPATDERFLLRLHRRTSVRPEDLPRAEDEGARAAGLVYERQWARERGVLREARQPLKVQLIDEKTEVRRKSLLHHQGQGDVHRLCVGPHVPSTGKLKAFKLLNTSNAY